MVATGLPGRPTNTASPSRPNASGRPGFIAICQKSSRPSRWTARTTWSIGEDPTDFGRIVGCDPEVRNFSRQRLEQSPENGAVGVVDAPLGKHGTGLQQLIAGRQQGYSQRRVDGQGGPAQLGSEPDILWT